VHSRLPRQLALLQLVAILLLPELVLAKARICLVVLERLAVLRAELLLPLAEARVLLDWLAAT